MSKLKLIRICSQRSQIKASLILSSHLPVYSLKTRNYESQGEFFEKLANLMNCLLFSTFSCCLTPTVYVYTMPQSHYLLQIMNKQDRRLKTSSNPLYARITTDKKSIFLLHNFTFFDNNRNIQQLKIVLIFQKLTIINGLQQFFVV